MKKIKLAEMNSEQVAQEIGDFIVDSVLVIPNFTGGVIGLSGGVDSTVTAALAKKAFHKHNFNSEKKLELIGYILPSEINNSEDTQDAVKIAQDLGIKYEAINIEPILESFKKTNPEAFSSFYDRGNLMSRIRANILSTKAATEKKIVIGTGNKDEDFCVGYYTLFGDGAVHISPIGNLSKRLVKQMASYLGFDYVRNKEPTAGLEPGQTDFRDLGYKYETAEIVIAGFEQGFNLEEIIKDESFVSSSKNDLENYFRIYGKLIFQNPREIIYDVIKRNNVAKAKARIIHPPAAEITLNYDLEET